MFHFYYVDPYVRKYEIQYWEYWVLRDRLVFNPTLLIEQNVLRTDISLYIPEWDIELNFLSQSQSLMRL